MKHGTAWVYDSLPTVGTRTFVSEAMGGLVIEALGYEAYRALGGDGRIE